MCDVCHRWEEDLKPYDLGEQNMYDTDLAVELVKERGVKHRNFGDFKKYNSDDFKGWFKTVL